MQDRMVTAKEVQALLSVSAPTLYRAIREGKFPPPIKIGRASRWWLSAVCKALGNEGYAEVFKSPLPENLNSQPNPA